MYVSSVRISTSTRLLLLLSVCAQLESSASQNFRLRKLLDSRNSVIRLRALPDPSRLILRLYDFLTTRRMHIYLPLSEIPGLRQKAGTAHELKPLSIPPVTSGNLRDPVFAPGSLGLTRNRGCQPHLLDPGHGCPQDCIWRNLSPFMSSSLGWQAHLLANF